TSGSFGKPHAFRMPTEAKYKILYPPIDLRFLVAGIAQGHDGVVVDLGDRRSVSRKAFCALRIRQQNCLVRFGIVQLHPRQQRGTEIEAYPRVVVYDIADDPLCVENPRGGIGRVAFGRDAFVPVVIGMRRILYFNDLQPCVLSRWLVKMAVYTYILLQGYSSFIL